MTTPTPRLEAVVVVPARDEEELVAGCIEALARQRGIARESWRILLVLDGCVDATAERAVAANREHNGPSLDLIELPAVGVGAARARGMDRACSLLERTGNPGGLIATTDADSRVAPDWLAEQLAAVQRGARAIGGRVVLDESGEGELLPATLQRRASEHASRLAAVAHQGPAQHPHFAGASIGVTADAYRAIGGLEPLSALEDESFARTLSAAGVAIHRLDSVRVTTSARRDGRAPRGLATDLAVAEWSARRTYDGAEWSLDDLIAAKDRTITAILPARECAQTIGPIVSQLAPLVELGLLEELVVVDADSVDGTARIAAEAGADVLSESDLLDELGPVRGKGDAMYRAVAATEGDLIVFLDADSAGFDPLLLTGLLGPMLDDPGLRLVKGAFRRHFEAGGRLSPDEGGRVTELVARPLLNLHFPLLAAFEQPLAGEIAIARELFERLTMPVGYGVEIAMLIDAARIAGLDAVAQSRLGVRRNRHQPLRSLSRMAYEVTVALQRRVPGAPEPVTGPILVGGDPTARDHPACEERPPLLDLHLDRAPTPGRDEGSLV